MEILIRVLVNAAALAVAAWLFDGIRISGSDTTDRVITLLIVAAIFGLVNAFVGTIVKLLTLPFIIITLGILLVVINAFLLLLTEWIADLVGLGFHVSGFGTAFFASIVISLVSWILTLVIDRD